MSIITKQQNFQLGELIVLPSRNCLQLGERQLSVQPKVMEVLQYLALHQDKVVSSDELMAQLWPGRIVTPASVQKSINALRKAIAELLGEQEVIAHYSRRGYQLLLPPVALEPVNPAAISLTAETTATALAEHQAQAALPARATSARPARFIIGMAFLLLVLLAGLWLIKGTTIARHVKPAAPVIEAQHQVQFKTWVQLISAPAPVRDAQPHPDGQHFVYVREEQHGDNRESQLIIRNGKNEDWLIASSQGTWVAQAWSPNGKQLVAVEQWRHKDVAATPGFYEPDNNLYTLHVFSLDLTSHRLLEKHLLSQWQGRVNSITWWDEHTLEFIAAQGQDLNYERYRYQIADQSLIALEHRKGMPLQSAVYKGNTLLVSSLEGRVGVELLDEKQKTQASWQFDYPAADVNYSAVDASWISDGSGVLLYSQTRKSLLALYWNGELKELRIPHNSQRPIHHLRYSPDGQYLYASETIKRDQLVWLSATGIEQPLASFAENASLAAWSGDGQQIAYAIEHNDSWQLRIQNRHAPEQVLPLSASPEQLLWANNDTHLVYRLGRQLVFFSLQHNSETRLPLEADGVEVIAYDATDNTLLVIKSRNNNRSLWTIDTQSLQQKQMTFGALSGALAWQGHVYFQYQNKPGLWRISQAQPQPLLLQENLPGNVALLAADENNIYFVRGGSCRETDIMRLGFSATQAEVALARNTQQVNTQSFHPLAGSLQRECKTPDANIILLR